MGQDCNQRIFRTTLSASIPHLRTALHATETAIIRPGLPSIASGRDYLQLTKCLVGALPAGSSRPTVLVRSTSARLRNGSNGCFIRLDLTVDKRLSLTWTYEMLY